MLARLLRRVRDTGRAVLSSLRQRLRDATKPAAATPLAGTLADLRRSKPELLAENALLRQQLSWPVSPSGLVSSTVAGKCQGLVPDGVTGQDRMAENA